MLLLLYTMKAYKVVREAHFPDAWGEGKSYDLAIVFPEEHIIIPYCERHRIMLEKGVKNGFSPLDNARRFNKSDWKGLEELSVLTPPEWADYMDENDVLNKDVPNRYVINKDGLNRIYGMQEIEVDDRIVKILKQKIYLDKRKKIVDKNLKEIIKRNLIEGSMN